MFPTLNEVRSDRQFPAGHYPSRMEVAASLRISWMPIPSLIPKVYRTRANQITDVITASPCGFGTNLSGTRKPDLAFKS